MKSKKYLAVGTALLIVALVVSLGCLGSSGEQKTAQEELKGQAGETFGEDKTEQLEGVGIKFYDVQEQTPQFVSYYDSITLTPEQEKIKSDALSSMPAPCCKDYSMLTCCCPCILSKSIWGLSNFLIVEQGYDAEQVRGAVSEWLSFTNENGYAGDACYVGRCERPFEEDACGGMEEMVLGTG